MALPVSSDAPKLYFAYGSNLSLPQMAQRCPGSLFCGLAVLHGYRWQINDRGVANVVMVADEKESGSNSTSVVQGLLYRVTAQNEEALDRYEGVSMGFYEKHTRSVQLMPHPRYADQPIEEVSQDVAQRLDSEGSLQARSPLSDFAGLASNDEPMPDEVTALVYISEHHTKDGRIRDEYVPRMQIAVRYALALGVTQAFVDSAISPYLEGKEIRGKGGDLGDRVAPSQKNTAAPDCGVADCLHSSQRLCRLRLENRRPCETTEISFNADLLTLLSQRMAKAEQNTAPEAEARHHCNTGSTGDRQVYVVVLQAPLLRDQFSYSIEAVTQNLALANELVLKTFRDACSWADREHDDNGAHNSSSRRTATNSVNRPLAGAQHQPTGWPGTFGYIIDDNDCLNLVLTPYGSGLQVRAWVTVQEILVA